MSDNNAMEVTKDIKHPNERTITLAESDLQNMLQAAATTALKEFRKEEAKAKNKNKYHDTFALMCCYRDAAFHVTNSISEGAQLELDGMTDEQKEIYLRSVRRTKFKTMLMLQNIDKAVEEMERRRKIAGRELEFKAFDMYFMQGMTYEQIIDQVQNDTGEQLGKNTPRRWITKIITEMSTLLWGIDDE